MSTETETFKLSKEVTQEIDEWLKKYPSNQKRSAVVTALLLAQDQNGGWLSEVAMNAVADYLGLSKIEVYEVATFYDMYDLHPTGKNKIRVCTNVSCLLCGAEEIIQCIEKKLGIKVGETTPDGKFTLRECECLAACVGAPMCQINDKYYYENLTPEKMEALIDDIARENV